MPYHIILYYFVLYYIMLYYTILYFTLYYREAGGQVASSTVLSALPPRRDFFENPTGALLTLHLLVLKHSILRKALASFTFSAGGNDSMLAKRLCHGQQKPAQVYMPSKLEGSMLRVQQVNVPCGRSATMA